MMIQQDLPRLSTRSRLALFGEETKKLEEHVHVRRTAYVEHSSRVTQLDFSIDQFLSKEVVSSSETKTTRDNFRFFVEQVGAIADGSSQEQDAARTMYNIVIRRKDSKEVAYSDAVSYFGKISQTKFDLIRTAALDLLQAKERATQLTNKSGASMTSNCCHSSSCGCSIHLLQSEQIKRSVKELEDTNAIYE